MFVCVRVHYMRRACTLRYGVPSLRVTPTSSFFPGSIPLLLPFALALELRPLLSSPVWANHEERVVAVLGTLGVGASSFVLILLEMAIVKRTSALSTDVLGYIKNLTVLVLAGVTFGDSLSPLNVAGVVVTFTAAMLYSYLKSTAPPATPKSSDQQVAYEILSVLEMSNNWSDDDDDDDADERGRHARREGRRRATGRFDDTDDDDDLGGGDDDEESGPLVAKRGTARSARTSGGVLPAGRGGTAALPVSGSSPASDVDSDPVDRRGVGALVSGVLATAQQSVARLSLGGGSGSGSGNGNGSGNGSGSVDASTVVYDRSAVARWTSQARQQANKGASLAYTDIPVATASPSRSRGNSSGGGSDAGGVTGPSSRRNSVSALGVPASAAVDANSGVRVDSGVDSARADTASPGLGDSLDLGSGVVVGSTSCADDAFMVLNASVGDDKTATPHLLDRSITGSLRDEASLSTATP